MTSDQVAVIAKSQTADPAIEAKLGPIVAKKQAIAALERDMQEKTQELERISEGQARVRENMKALKGSDSERELIQRYTRQLGSQEDRIETLTREGAALEAQRKAAQTELDALVDALALDVVVKGA
jgi:DNA repair exonuclease SbcCD ATPase subunit